MSVPFILETAPRSCEYNSDVDIDYDSGQETLCVNYNIVNDPQSQSAKMERQMENLTLDMTSLRDELRASKAEARAYQEELERFKLKAEAREFKLLKDSQATIILLKDELRASKAEARSYHDELERSNTKLQEAERLIHRHSEDPATEIGRDVRHRYLEHHRRHKMALPFNGDLIKAGSRAAHRAKPIADAWLYTTGGRTDTHVYADLYGITPEEMMAKWKGVPEVVEVRGFHGTLKSEFGVSEQFLALFGEFESAVQRYESPEEFRRGFDADGKLQRVYCELQDCYDAIVHANPRSGGRYRRGNGGL